MYLRIIALAAVCSTVLDSELSAVGKLNCWWNGQKKAGTEYSFPGRRKDII